MNTDRFKNYEDDVKLLVLDFESMERRGSNRYFDVDQMETIIDFYLETADSEMLEKSVRYGEQLFPTSNEIRLRRAHLLCFKERYDEALNLLKQLQQIEPNDTDVLYALGVVYGALDQHRKAIQYYHKAEADGYELATIYANIADEYAKMDMLADARTYYRKALSINPDDEHSIFELANCYEDEGLTDKWIRFFSNFVEQHPYSRTAWFCLAEAYVVEQLYEKAIDAYQYALAIDDNYFDAYMQLASCHFAMDDYSNAVATLHESLAHTDDKAYVYYRLGEIFKSQNNIVTANVYYRKAVNEDPYYAEAWHMLALNYGITHSYYAAIDAIERALKIDRESPVYLTTLALLYADNGDFDKAEEVFDKAIPYYSDFEQGWLVYTDCLIMQERFADAREVLVRELPDCDLVLEFSKRLALCYYNLGQRNLLFNAVRDCICEENGEQQLLDYCPELNNDYEVMNIIESHRRESQKDQQQ